MRLAVFMAALLIIIIAALPAEQNQALPTTPVSLSVSDADINPPPLPQEFETKPPPALQWIHVRVKNGDNMARIFQRLNLSPTDLHNIMEIGSDVRSLKRILPEQELSFQLQPDGGLQAIRYQQDAFKTLQVVRTDTGFRAEWDIAEPETITVFETAKITPENPSLFHAGKAAGLSDYVIMELAQIFQWDISFALDMRNGDSFSLMFEEIYVEGEKVKEGKIVAAKFTNMGKTYSAVRYTDLSGRADYYTPAGHSMRKAFIRDPVHFSHVSSSFNLRRLHPIHKRAMPHRGIDYAAKRGTPVFASGDGKVTIRRQNEASGRYIVIQHGEQYTTKYLHLSAFARGIKPGAKVRQGQTIGYVGSSGWATGPHLHYEFLVNGVHRNPRTVRLPKADPIARDELARFQAAVSPVLAQLEAIVGTSHLAASESQEPPTGG